MSPPKVVIAPITSAVQPYVLKLGTKLLVTLTIETLTSDGHAYQLIGSNLSKECYTLGSAAMSADDDDHDQIEVLIHPPQVAAMGEHKLGLQLHSDDGEVIWEDSVYLQFLAADNLEITLTPDLQTVEDGVGLYQLLITNTSELERALVLHPKGLPSGNGCVFRTEPSQLTLSPDVTEKVELMVQPQRWWLRPWFGDGRKFRFQVDLEESNGTLLPQLLAQGTLVWQPYPRPQSSKFLALLLLALVTSSALIGQALLRRQDTPAIATLKSSQAIVPPTGQKDIQLSWTIKNGPKLSKLVLLREGKGGSEVLKTFWFTKGIPNELKRSQPQQTADFCEYEPSQSNVLKCNGISTKTADAGNYNFKLQAFSTSSGKPEDAETTPWITFEPNAIPQIVKFNAPNGSPRASTKGPIASVAQGPVKLNWDVTNPGQIGELQIVTVDANNSAAVLLKRYSFQGGKLPDDLAKSCKFGPVLTCQNIPTAARKPGQYYFKINVVYQHDQKSFTTSKTIGPIDLQAEPLKIASFQINGQKAPANYVLKAGQTSLDLTWKVVGGNDPKVTILPNPGKSPVAGSTKVKLDPQQQKAITLHATDLNGKQVLQTVALQGNVASTPAPPSITSAQSSSQSSAQPGSGPPPPAFIPLQTPSQAMPQTPPRVAGKPVPVSKPPGTEVAKASSKPQYSQKSFEEAQRITRGLVVARQKGKIILNGSAWNKTQDAITLLRRGYSREQAAQKAGVPLWKLDVLTDLGKRTK